MSDADRARFRIGAEGNPVYPEIYRRPMTSAGGVMLACRLTLDGGIVHCPGGGTHHGRPARASGFCYLNDPVLGIMTWLEAGLDNIVYLDIDAHHGDGVQDAFHDDDRVLTISVHEAGRWPFTGRADDRAGGAARNLPVPRGFNDTEMRWLLRARGPAADPRATAAGDLPAMRGRRAGGRPAGQAVAVQQRAFRRGGRHARPGAAAGGDRGRRLQSLYGRALLGGRVGDAQPYPDPAPDDARRRRRCCGRSSITGRPGATRPSTGSPPSRTTPREGAGARRGQARGGDDVA